jgi:Pvc16 N-terminal domain
MAGVQAIQGVDDTLRGVSATAVAALVPKPKITVGALDAQDEDLRLNWFLYRVSPSATFRNMEPPQTGWHTARGRPPLALRLSYLLSAFPAKTAGAGDQEQFAHAGMAAVMRALHEHAIIAEGEPALSPLAQPLVEPLRITMDDLDLEAVTKLWTAATAPIRLSVGYEVSLVIVDSETGHSAGPPVRTRRFAVVPSLGPRLASVTPARVTAGIDIAVAGAGLTSATLFTLAREAGDPGGAGDWPMTAVPGAPPGQVVLRLPDDRLVPGLRRLDAAATEAGLPAGRDSIGLTIVPAVTGPAGPLPRGVPVTLETAHAAPDVEVFIGGAPIDATDVSFASPTEVEVTIPAATPPGPTELLLRAGKVAGPPAEVTIAP